MFDSPVAIFLSLFYLTISGDFILSLEDDVAPPPPELTGEGICKNISINYLYLLIIYLFSFSKEDVKGKYNNYFNSCNSD